MASISFDGQSLVIEGRRVWLVSGSMHYSRVPRGQWRSAIAAAKQAGLNCICTSVFWNVHEKAPKRFDFEGEADLRHFVELIGEAGLYCIVRPGPFVGLGWDFGGLPPWLLRDPQMQVREGYGPYLEACARYVGQVMGQIKDLQVTASTPGPIVMMQAENQWLCYNPDQGQKYLREIVRYLRENGCAVPVTVANNLWQRVDGAVDTWCANDRLASDLRQLRIVQPQAPRFVSELWCGGHESWGQKGESVCDADATLVRLAQTLAAAAQYNLYLFRGGTNFGFYGGRTVGRADEFATTSYDHAAPVSEGGARGATYAAVKRISMFASQFGHVLAHVNPDPQPITADPGACGDGEHGVSVIHQRGAQGDVVYLIGRREAKAGPVALLLGDGRSVSVPMGHEPAAWVLVNANLNGAATLDYTNLRPWAMIARKMLVLFGPAGADGLLKLNGALVHMKVPTGGRPLVEEHEDLIVVVANTAQIDAAYLTGGGLVVGAAGLDDDDEPVAHPKFSSIIEVLIDGSVRTIRKSVRRVGAAPRLREWRQCPATEFVSGQAASFKKIDEPASLEELGCDFGYGWYRFEAAAAKASVMPPGGDRLHLYQEGKLTALMGVGPGARYDTQSLDLAAGTTTILADNLGRYCFGWHVGERKGLLSDMYAVKPVRWPRAKTVAMADIDPFDVAGCLVGMRADEPVPTEAFWWKVQNTGRKPMVLDIQDLPVRAMVIVNNEPLVMYHPHHSAGVLRMWLEVGDAIKGGRNDIRVAVFADNVKSATVTKHMKLYQCTQVLSKAGSWAFSPWLVPGENAGGFEALASRRSTLPCWYRTTFESGEDDGQLWLHARGMSKGQIVLNGQNVGRYFVATASGRSVGPQSRYYLPQPWLRTDGPNELLMFDEHGMQPTKCRLVRERR